MALIHSPSIITSNLVLYVDAANTRSPALGNTTLTLNNGLASPANGYYTFDGVDDSISINSSDVYNVSWTSGKTVLVGCWLDSTVVYGGTPYFRAMLGNSTSSRNVNLYLYLDATGYRLHFSTGPAGSLYGSFSNYLTVSTQTWYIWGISQAANGTIKYWQNATNVGSVAHTLSGYQTGSEWLGRADNYWAGRIGFWQVYNTELTSEQINQNYNALRGRYGI